MVLALRHLRLFKLGELDKNIKMKTFIGSLVNSFPWQVNIMAYLYLNQADKQETMSNKPKTSTYSL